jgi:hypothetical protein
MALLGWTAFVSLSAAHRIIKKIREVVDEATKLVIAIRRFYGIWRQAPVTTSVTGCKGAKKRLDRPARKRPKTSALTVKTVAGPVRSDA